MAEQNAGAPTGAEQKTEQQVQPTTTPDPKQAASQQSAAQPPAAAGAKAPAPPLPGTQPEPGEEPPVDARNMITLPAREFKERVAKASRKTLREIFGTSDHDTIRTIKRKFDEWEGEREKQRKEQLSNEQKLTEERDSALKQRDEAIARARRAKDRVDNHKIERGMRRLAGDFIHHEKVDHALDLMQAALLNMSRREARHLPKDWAEKFLSRLAEDAYFGKSGSHAETPPAGATPPAKSPLTSGATSKATKPSPAPAASGEFLVNGKTTRPGQANSMSKEELRQWAQEAERTGLLPKGVAGAL